MSLKAESVSSGSTSARIVQRAHAEQAATLVERRADQARLLAALSRPAVFGPGCTRVGRLETHISCVPLTGRDGYKIKRAVDFDGQVGAAGVGHGGVDRQPGGCMSL